MENTGDPQLGLTDLLGGGSDVRTERIVENVHDIMHKIMDEASDWIGVEPEPQWHELRDAVQRWLFSMEYERGKCDGVSED